MHWDTPFVQQLIEHGNPLVQSWSILFGNRSLGGIQIRQSTRMSFVESGETEFQPVTI